MKEPPEEYDCQSCGACCVDQTTTLPSYVAVSEAEGQRLTALGLPVLRDSDGGELALGSVPWSDGDGQRVCIAFAGRVGGRCACSIYPDRPSACVRFQPGSFLCKLARRDAGLTP